MPPSVRSCALACLALLVPASLLASRPPIGAAAAAATGDPAALVDPFIGTANGGFTIPGADRPFGMVQLSPDTAPVSTSIPFQAAAGQGYSYSYSDSVIHGFGMTHLSGTGCPIYGDAPLMPTVGAVTSSDPHVYESGFSHALESAHPGEYSVRLLGSGAQVDVSATARTGWMRLTFPPVSQANVLLNTGNDSSGVIDSGIGIGATSVDEVVTGGGFCGSSERYTVYAHVEFSRPFTGFGTWQGSTLSPGTRAATGSASGGWVSFDARSDSTVVVRVGISFTSADEARRNLAAETPAGGFDAVVTGAREAWNQYLGRVSVTGAPSQQPVFYTALYRALQYPSTFSDVDGSYMGFDGQVHVASGWTQLANLSLWDTYRSQTQLLELVAPERARDLALSLIADAREGGWMPKWPVANGDSNTQQGDSATPTLVDLYLKGFLSADEAEAAYAAMLHNAEATPPQSSPFAGRPYLDAYARAGWVPFVFPTSFPSGASGAAGYATLFAASVTQEYALDDCDLAQMAAALGHDADRRMLALRSTHWRTLFDSGSGFVRPRTASGAFASPFDPAVSNLGFEEGSAWEYLWFEPQDIAGLIDRLGGPDATTAKLDQFFQFDELAAAPQAVAASQEAQGAAGLVLHDPQYSPDNEPDIQVPYMYLYTGSAWKTQAVVRAEETTYNATPAGIPGNDDMGTMSAWYVLSTMGIYPMTYGLPVWGVTTPAFDTVTVSLEQPWYTHPTLTISAPGASAGDVYIQSATLNGAPLRPAWVDHSQLDGGDLRLVVGARPAPSWGAAPPPPSPCGGADGLGNSTSSPAGAVQAGSTAALPDTVAGQPAVPGGIAVLLLGVVGAVARRRSR